MPAVLTWRGARLVLASSVWLTIYVLCMLMVASFIFFEVLDVDGSDFPTAPSQMDARLAEAHHDEIKRLWQPLKIWADTATPEIQGVDRAESETPVLASPRPPIRRYRAALPRSGLSEPPSA
jgi:hypothetical protein